VINHKRPSGGIGLVNVRRRLDLLYPDSYALKISDEAEKYKVSLTLALNEIADQTIL
jgi:LytS/YehU family sensor histidine kinase